MSVFQNGLGSLLVSWTPGQTIATGYIIYYQQQDGGQKLSMTAGATDTSITITGLITGATYSISVASTSGTLPSTETAAPHDITIGEVAINDLLMKFYAHVLLSSAEPVTISLTSSPSSPVMAGESVTLTCSVTLPDGVTSTPDFQWEGPGGVTLTPAASTTSGQTVSSDLTLSEISTSQAGQYTCTATLYGSNTTSTTITVQSKPGLFLFFHAILCSLLLLQSQCPLHPSLSILLFQLLELHSL